VVSGCTTGEDQLRERDGRDGGVVVAVVGAVVEVVVVVV